MTLMFILTAFVLTLIAPLGLRGGALHNLLVNRTAVAFRQHGFEVRLEHRLWLKDGRADYADILAWCGTYAVICEIETSARYAGVNAAKANELGIPLWIVVPNRQVLRAVARKLNRTAYELNGKPIRILLQAEVCRELANCFPTSSAVNAETENKKKCVGREKHGGSRV